MKNALKYFIKIILFAALWFLQMAISVYFVMEYYGELRPNSSIVIIGITAIYSSYRIVKHINVSKLFSRKKNKQKKEEVITITEEKPSLINKFLMFLKRRYKILVLIVVLLSFGGYLINTPYHPISLIINPPDAFDWDDRRHIKVKSQEVVQSNDSLYYLRSDMSLFTGRILEFDGDNLFQQTFLNGKKHGVDGLQISGWYSSRYNDGRFYYLNYFKNGLKDGKWESWHLSDGDSFQLASRTFYEGGLKQGDWKEWDEDGNLIKHWVMKDDVPIKKIIE
jgi:antitoxin component YwqK of YwqJK toxin-antitoxin module